MPYGPRSSERALISEKENKTVLLKHSFISYFMPHHIPSNVVFIAKTFYHRVEFQIRELVL